MNNFQSLPTITKNILIINILLFAATWIYLKQGIHLENILGLHYFNSKTFKPYQVITYLFMHADILHIFFNMLGLFMFGSVLENVWGPKRFLTYYILTGIGAAIAQTLFVYSQIPPGAEVNGCIGVGASGSLYGVLIAFAWMFPNTELMMMFIPIPIKAKFLIPGFAVMELFSGLRNNPTDNIAHFAHLGGLLFGIIILLIWRVKRIN
ncbi:MAG TPA: rhomboid family intramembrane serine protease [Bacteroidia bacterium]|jgi:membrane associated rhomboid family serine protease|nr:rhomboid family intramembrane serine protease [Bacteroidia bacterium]